MARRLRSWVHSAVGEAGTTDRTVMARAFALLYGSGATLVLATLALPTGFDRWEPGIVGPALIAYGVVALMIARADRLPLWFLRLLPPWGTVLVSVVVLSGGEAATAYAAMYLWVVLSAFYFFSASYGAFNLGLVGAAYAGIVLARSQDAAAIDWIMALGALTVAGLLIGLLRDRVDGLIANLRRHLGRQAGLASLGDRALAGAPPAELMDRAAEAIADGLDVELVELLQPASDGGALLLRAGHGWGGRLVRNLRVPLSVSQLFERDGKPLCHHVEHGVVASVLVPVRDGERDYAVIGAHSRRPREFSSLERGFLEAVARVLSHAFSRERAERELRRRSLYDSVTGLPNRTLFGDRLAQALERARGERSQVAVLLTDIDGFKTLNDAFGHEIGDQLLTAVGRRIRDALFVTDSVARLSGDEYAVLCEGIPGAAGAQAVAERIREALAQPFQLGRRSIRITATVGIALSNPLETADALIRDADAAMYRAKERGRNRSELFDDNLRANLLSRVALENALRGALEREELSLRYQPVVSLPGAAIEGVEALLRWNHSALGPVSPAEFIPIAEQSDLIVPIGEWVLEQACSQASRWHRLGHRIAINVNVSARQLNHRGLVPLVRRLLEQSQLEPGTLGLELTESALMEDARLAAEILAELKQLGVRIVLDDFGTGYSSLHYVKRFPIDSIKVDRSFVMQLERNNGDAAIISAIAGIARAFDLGLVAEGVETHEQARIVAELGCRQAQGFLFSKPVRARDVMPLLGANFYPPTAESASSLVE